MMRSGCHWRRTTLSPRWHLPHNLGSGPLTYKLRNLILSAREKWNYWSWERAMNKVHWDWNIELTSFSGMTNPLVNIISLFLDTQSIRKLEYGESIIHFAVPQNFNIEHAKTYKIASQLRLIPWPQEMCSLLKRHWLINANLIMV